MPSSDSDPIIPIKEFEAEMATTRKMLESLPTDQDGFKPHEKSMEFGKLSRLVSVIPDWIVQTLRGDHIDIATGPQYSQTKAADIISNFDGYVREATAALKEVTGDALNADWSLKANGKILMTMPRKEAARQHLNHLIHHRGQLAVYERMVNMKLPQIYGPSADAPWQG